MDRYKDAPSKHAAEAIAKVSGVKYSELSRLPYFNTVDNFLVDPMHNLFLRLVEDIGNAIIVGDENFIDANGLQAFQERMNAMRLPYGVGRLPRTNAKYDDRKRDNCPALEKFHHYLCTSLSLEGGK